MLSIFLNESISKMARSALMRVPIAIYLSRIYLLSRRFSGSSRRFSRSSRRFSRSSPTFLEKSPTFFRTTPTFFLYIPAFAASHSPLSTTGRPHRRTIYRQPRALAQPNSEGSQALFSTSFAKPTFQTLSTKHKITHTFHRKGEQKGGFHLSHPFFCSKT